ncbi:uncharacterized protein LOC120671112 [Panicum virgatum]|uniref:uncharacterized protein LOC120671112 n=1 Tax=Panicum virgatum TaxID=38727 RepID=UPI0019D625B2|nr:uncharacterized protein LOC120671112 [Panicum virgatum]
MPGSTSNFRFVPFEHEDQMRIMFEAVIVTNETFYVPTGHGNSDQVGEGDAEGNDDGEISRIGTSKERRAGKRAAHYSPKGNKKKTFRDQCMKRLVDAYEIKEVFNHAHSSLRNVIEQSFGVLKMKWRILLNLPSHLVNKQSKIIVACMALHNFIRECDLEDPHFQEDVEDDSPHPTYDNKDDGGTGDDVDMNAFRDAIATAMVS